MKHLSKALLLVLVLVLSVGVFASCSSTEGLTKESEALGSPEKVARNKEPYSTTLIPYESVEQALGGDYSASPYYKSLNGDWDFSLVLNPKLVPVGFEKKDYAYTYSDFTAVRVKEEDPVTWGTISIPSNWEMKGYDAPSYTYNTYPWGDKLVAPTISETYNPVGIYRNKIEVPSDWSDRQVYVTFDGVASCVYVYVNGAMIGYAEDSYTGKTFNITDAVEFGKENLVVFEVYKYCDGSYLEANDSIKFGGIYRDVYLYAAPKTQIRDFTYDMQMSGENALLNANVTIASYDEPSGSLSVELAIYDEQGNCIYQPAKVGNKVNFAEKIISSANAYVGEVGGRIAVTAPKLWSAETPNLYTLVLQLKDGDDVLDTVSKRIGFKTIGVTVDDNGRQSLVLNDKTIVLRGILYNENSPVNGMVVSRDEMINDIKLMKQMNINAVRSPGRPLSAEFIALCDEYGLYVIDDMSLNSNPYSNKDESSIPGNQTVWQAACLDRLLNVVYRDKNSASVIMWALGSDSGLGSNFSILRNWLTSSDSRMIIYDDDESASDLVISSNLSLNDFAQLVSDSGNKKPVLLQDTRGGLLNNGGNFSAYAELMDQYANFQGGFFAYWADNAIYWPVTDAANTLSTLPYSEETADYYRLAYAGGWGDTSSASDGYMSLSGVLTADRLTQGDVLELRNALSPIYISLDDAAKGTFNVSNRNGFTDFADVYAISYEVTDGKTVLSTGTVSDFEVKAGQSSSFTVNLPTGAKYVYFTVKYKTAPSWLSGDDLTVFAKQISLSEDTAVEKDGSVQNISGANLDLSIFQVPQISSSGYLFADGSVYVTNLSKQNFSENYSISWVIYEQHPLWSSKAWVVYDEGSLDSLNVPAETRNHHLRLPIDVDGAVVNGNYAAYITITSKKDVAGVPAGTNFVYVINPNGSSDNIPLKTNPARDPIIIGEVNHEGVLGPAPGDEEPVAENGEELVGVYYELPAVENSYKGASIISIKNDKVSILVNLDTGLITQYSVDGKDIFVNNESSMISNLYRNPTGGDLTSSFLTANTGKTLQSLSQNFTSTKNLFNGYKVTQVSAQHYRIVLDYLWVTYPVNAARTFSFDTYYTVTYDVYASGEIQVSVDYDPSIKTVAPLELSSIMALTSEFKTMSWFGMGSGDSYSDKTADGRTGVYEDVSIVDQLGGEYIYSTGNGDKTDLRWVALEREDGSGIVITSDSDRFAVNVSKDYPWNSSSYPTQPILLSSRNTILRVIGQQRGISANTLFDEEYSKASYLVPGVNYSYSFRIVPVSSGYDADKISRTTLSNSVIEKTETITLDNNSFSLINGASTNTVLSSGAEGAVSMIAPLGNASQYWIREDAPEIVSLLYSGIFRIKSVANGQYLSPVLRDQYGVIAKQGELTVAPYYKNNWQNWMYQDGQLFPVDYTPAGGGFHALYIAGSNTSNAGVRLALQAAKSDSLSKWTIIADANDPTRIRIQSVHSGKYMTLVDKLTYSSPVVEDYAFRMRNYTPRVIWGDYATVARAIRYNNSNTNEWVGADNYVTLWDLLPADSQMWTFVPANGGYLMVNKQTGSALTLKDGVLSETAVDNSAAQIWKVVAKDGMYGIVNVATNQALTLRSVGGNIVLTAQEWEGLAIQLWALNSSEDQKVNIVAGENWY